MYTAIYLDNAATTRIEPKVLEAMMPYLKNEFGNAGAIYGLGRQAADAINNARRQVADLISASPEQIIFTSGGSEANSLVLHGIRTYLKRKGKNRIVTSVVEHDSVLNSINALCGSLRCNNQELIKDGFCASFLKVNEYGVVSAEELQNLLTEDAGLVSVMYVNNETGSVNPIKEIGRICSEKNILFHTDCVQAAGCHLIDVNEIGCDFLSISSHKIHGPKGVGALYVKDKELISPIIYGGAGQEFGLRGGTENVAGIVGFGKACEIAQEGLEDFRETTIFYKQRFINKLRKELVKKHIDFYINGEDENKPGRILNIRFQNIDGETLLLLLDAKGVCASAGSACRSHESEPSRVLLAMGLSPEEARSSIRVSFSECNSLREVEIASEIFADCVESLRDGFIMTDSSCELNIV